MGELLPAGDLGLNKGGPEHYSAGTHGMAKVERYNLTALILKLNEDGITFREISRRCNDELMGRSDGRAYHQIIPKNIERFVHRYNKASFLSFADRHAEDFGRYQDPISLVHEMCQNLRVEIKYAQEHRERNGQMKFRETYTEHMKQLNDALNTMGNLYQKMQPTWTVALFRANLRALGNEFLAADYLTQDQKNKVLDAIQRNMLSDTFIHAVDAQAREAE